MSVAFYHDEDQKRMIDETKAEQEARRKRDIATEIRPAVNFTGPKTIIRNTTCVSSDCSRTNTKPFTRNPGCLQIQPPRPG